MGRYFTPAGVVIEMADKAALAVGYKAEAPTETAPSADTEAPAPKRRTSKSKKSE